MKTMKNIKYFIFPLILGLMPFWVYAEPSFANTIEDSGSGGVLNTIWVVGNIDSIINALEASAMIFNTGTWQKALVLAVLLAIMAMAVALVVKRTFQPYNYIVFLILTLALFVPKTTVYVASYYEPDPVTGTPRGGNVGAISTKAVGNVPIGVAWPLGITSSIAKSFTEMFDTAYTNVEEDSSYLVQGAEGYFSPLRMQLRLRNAWADPMIMKNLSAIRSRCLTEGISEAIHNKGGIRAGLDAPPKSGYRIVGGNIVSGFKFKDDMKSYNVDCSLALTLVYYQMLANVYIDEAKGYSPLAEKFAKTRTFSNEVLGVENDAKKKNLDTRARRAQQEMDALSKVILKKMGQSDTSGVVNPNDFLEETKQKISKPEFSEFHQKADILPTMQGPIIGNYVNSAEIQANIVYGNFVANCFDTNSDVCFKTNMLLSDGYARANIDNAGEASMFQHFLHHSMNVLVFVYIVMSPIMIIVILAMGLGGWRLITSYLMLAVWVNSWLPLSVGITNYMLAGYDSSLSNLINALTYATAGDDINASVLSPTVLTTILQGAQDMIGSASSMLSMVPTIMFALLAGSPYAFTAIAQRAGMTGKDYIDETKVVHDLERDETIGALARLSGSVRTTTTGTLSSSQLPRQLLSNQALTSKDVITVSESEAYANNIQAARSHMQLFSETYGTAKSIALLGSNGEVVEDGMVVTIDKNNNATVHHLKAGQNISSIMDSSSTVVARQQQASASGGLSAPLGVFSYQLSDTDSSTDQRSNAQSNNKSFNVQDAVDEGGNKITDFNTATGIKTSHGLVENKQLQQTLSQDKSEQMSKMESRIRSYEQTHSSTWQMPFQITDINSVFEGYDGYIIDREMGQAVDIAKRFSNNAGVLLEQAVNTGQTEKFAHTLMTLMESSNLNEKLAGYAALYTYTNDLATDKGARLHNAMGRVLNSYGSKAELGMEVEGSLAKKIDAMNIEVGQFAHETDLHAEKIAMANEYGDKYHKPAVEQIQGAENQIDESNKKLEQSAKESIVKTGFDATDEQGRRKAGVNNKGEVSIGGVGLSMMRTFDGNDPNNKMDTTYTLNQSDQVNASIENSRLRSENKDAVIDYQKNGESHLAQDDKTGQLTKDRVLNSTSSIQQNILVHSDEFKREPVPEDSHKVQPERVMDSDWAEEEWRKGNLAEAISMMTKDNYDQPKNVNPPISPSYLSSTPNSHAHSGSLNNAGNSQGQEQVLMHAVDSSSSDGHSEDASITGKVYRSKHFTNEKAEAIREVAKRIGVDPNDLAQVISFETSGTFSTNIRNPKSSATGLIQFMKGSGGEKGKYYGMTRDEFGRLSFEEQMKYVEKYFKDRGFRADKPQDIAALYNAVTGVPKKGYKEGTDAYKHNIVWDANRDGIILPGEESQSKDFKKHKRKYF